VGKENPMGKAEIAAILVIRVMLAGGTPNTEEVEYE
jgi:hypothetical protein